MKKDGKSGSIEAKYVYSLHQRWNISVGQNCLDLEKMIKISEDIEAKYAHISQTLLTLAAALEPKMLNTLCKPNLNSHINIS